MTFVIHSVPKGKGRPRFSKWGAYTPTETRKYESFIASEYESQCGGYKASEGALLYVSMTFFFPIPKSTSKKKASQMAFKPHTKKPDIDNCIKAVLDALNGKAYPDDSAIYHIEAIKCYTPDEPCTVVTITEDGEENV